MSHPFSPVLPKTPSVRNRQGPYALAREWQLAGEGD
jgi:hypothetical protein